MISKKYFERLRNDLVFYQVNPSSGKPPVAKCWFIEHLSHTKVAEQCDQNHNSDICEFGHASS
jgi:hypothetical protein